MTHKPDQNRIRFTAVALVVGAALGPGSWDLFAADVQVGRYRSVFAGPTEGQADLLSAMVTVEVPSGVSTVGEAVHYLLRGSGYRLAAETASDPARADLLGLPLPEAHRSLGPMPLQDALETLGGPAFRLVEDPLHRLVSFERCSAPGRSPAAQPDRERR